MLRPGQGRNCWRRQREPLARGDAGRVAVDVGVLDMGFTGLGIQATGHKGFDGRHERSHLAMGMV
ncbi:hypothetical protein BHS04_04790 [Myxococcus xanthus]|nr:hypothetical protein BHS04_04790 [Myxococcus xanthus]